MTDYEQGQLRSGAITNLIADFLYGAVGSGSATPVSTDTALGAEEVRNALQESVRFTDNIVFSVFVNSTQSNGTVLHESGWFKVAGASAGTARQRAVIDAVSKDENSELCIDKRINLSITQ